jgi:patatin-like phospholipase/acyl hydrolase
VHQTESKRRFQILSLDGGGLKGLFTAAFLAKWEQEQKTRVVDHFDLIAGTSTGGIIALGLGLGFSAEDVKNLYLQKAEQIFPPSLLGNAKHWISVKYSAEGLKAALEELFQDRKLGDSTKRLLIPAYDPAFKGIHIFKTAHHRRLHTDHKQTAVHVALATSAAPTYFEPEETESGLQLVDGGVWANNPVMLAVAEAMGYLERDQREIAALRIGTTEEVISIDSLKTSGGKIQIAAPLINFMMRGQSQSASGMVLHLLGKERFHQINPVSAPGDFHLDKLRKELVALGEAEWRHESSELMDKGFFDHQAVPFEPCYQPN